MTTPASATFITRGTSSVRRILAIASGVLLLTASLAHAQRATERGYLVGGISVDHQSGATGEVQELYITAPGGWTTGWTLGAGVHAGEHVSIEGEVSATGVMKAREPSRYDITYDEERRDLFVSALLRMRPSRGSRVAFEPVAGASLVTHQAWSQNEYARYTGTLPVTVTVDPRQSRDLPMSLALTGGLDARIGARRLAVMPSFRVRRRIHRLNGENDFEWWYPGGMPSTTVSVGVLLRVAF
ncbi:MAG: hypothetical protein U0Q11_11015 [Vicinamibacterales bacterium]